MVEKIKILDSTGFNSSKRTKHHRKIDGAPDKHYSGKSEKCSQQQMTADGSTRRN